jgi:DNA-directed RNA polymerase subunit M/transcription elongation factor TFIIS
MGKLKTPDWILKGEKRPVKKKEKGVFKIRKCPKCGSDNVNIILSGSDSEEESNTGKQWECRKCKWKGSNISMEQVSEEEFMKYLDERGEEVA